MQLLALGGLIDTAKAVLGGGGPIVAIPGLPMEFGADKERTVLKRQPPAIGEHSQAVLAEAGLTPEEVAALMAQSIIVNRAVSPAVAAAE